MPWNSIAHTARESPKGERLPRRYDDRDQEAAMAIRITRTRSTWTLIAALMVMTVAQPTAYGLDFPSTTQLTLPDTPALSLTATREFSPAQSITVPIPELAKIALISRQIEMARTTVGAKVVTRTIMADEYNWGSYQFGCLNSLWTKESHWNYKAHNSRSGAHGIAQALPASKMDVISTDWRTNPLTQIRWGLRYIEDRYKTPCGAWKKFKRSRYY